MNLLQQFADVVSQNKILKYVSVRKILIINLPLQLVPGGLGLSIALLELDGGSTNRV